MIRRKGGENWCGRKIIRPDVDASAKKDGRLQPIPAPLLLIEEERRQKGERVKDS